MTVLANMPDELHLINQTYYIKEQWLDYVDGTMWTAGGDAGGSAAISDSSPPTMVITTDGDDEDEYFLKSDIEAFKFASNKQCGVSITCTFTEADTDKANIFVGAVDAVAADLMVDAGAGPKTTASAMGFEKRDGETVWRAFSSVGTTQTSTKLDADNKNNLTGVAQTAGGATYKRMICIFTSITATDGYIDFFIDDSNGKPVHVAKHKNIDYSSATDMEVGLYAKAGSANAEALNVRPVGVWQKY